MLVARSISHDSSESSVILLRRRGGVALAFAAGAVSLFACSGPALDPSDAGVDAAPVRFDSDRSVVCEGLVLPQQAGGIAPGGGEVAWAFDLTHDASVVGAIQTQFPGVAPAPSTLPLTSLAEGGVSAWLDSGPGLLTLSATGEFASLRFGSAPGSAIVRLAPSDVILKRIGGQLLAVGADAGWDGAPWALISPAGAGSTDDSVAASLPVVIPDTGRVIWTSAPDVVQSNCVRSGAFEWAVRFRSDFPDGWGSGRAMVGAADGSVLAQTGPGSMVRLSALGDPVAYRVDYSNNVLALSLRCGVLVGGAWWSPDTFETTSEVGPFAELPEGPFDAYYGGQVVLSDCSTATVGARRGTGSSIDAWLLLARSDGSSAVGAVPGFVAGSYVYGPLYPLGDGGVLLLQSDPVAGGSDTTLRVTTFNGDGSVRWTRQYGSEYGAEFSQGASVLDDTGTLYAVTRGGSLRDGYVYRVVAFRVGTAPASYDWLGSGVNWRRTGVALAGR